MKKNNTSIGVPTLINFKEYNNLNDVLNWIVKNRNKLLENLYRSGSLLLTNIPEMNINIFEKIAKILDSELSHTHALDDGIHNWKSEFVFEDTETSANSFPDIVSFHNVDSFLPLHPEKIMYACVKPPNDGGEFLLTDCRVLFNKIQKYLNNFHLVNQFLTSPLALDYKVISQNLSLNSKSSIVDHIKTLKAQNIKWNNNTIKMNFILPVTIQHPKTKEKIWFNRLRVTSKLLHAIDLIFSLKFICITKYKFRMFFVALIFFYKYLKEKMLNKKSKKVDDNLTFTNNFKLSFKQNIYIMHLYWKYAYKIKLQKNDVLVVDNRLTAICRMPYKGTSSIFSCMSKPTLYNKNK